MVPAFAKLVRCHKFHGGMNYNPMWAVPADLGDDKPEFKCTGTCVEEELTDQPAVNGVYLWRAKCSENEVWEENRTP